MTWTWPCLEIVKKKKVNRALTSFIFLLYNSFQRGLVLLRKTHVRHWKGLIENEHRALNQQGRWWPFAPVCSKPGTSCSRGTEKQSLCNQVPWNLCLWISPTLCSSLNWGVREKYNSWNQVFHCPLILCSPHCLNPTACNTRSTSNRQDNGIAVADN